MRYKVLFRGSEEVKKFADFMNQFDSDVNIYFGHQIFDAKSVLCLMSLQLFKAYEVELMTENKDEQDKFAEVVSKYGG